MVRVDSCLYAGTPDFFESLPNWRPVYQRNETVTFQSSGGYLGYKILPGTFDRPNAAVIVTDPFSMATKVPFIPPALQLSMTGGILLESTPMKALEIQMKVSMPSGVRINEMCDRSNLMQVSFPTMFFYDKISKQWESLPTINISRSDQQGTIMQATIPPDVLIRNGLQLMLGLAAGVPHNEQNTSVGAYIIPVRGTVSIGRENFIKYEAASPLDECVIPMPSRALEMQQLRLLKFRSLGAPVSMFLTKRPNVTVKVELPLITDAGEVGTRRRRNLLQQTGGSETTVVFFNTTSQTWQTMDQCVLNSTAVPVSMVCSLDPSFFSSNGLFILLAPVVTEPTTTTTLPGSTTTTTTTALPGSTTFKSTTTTVRSTTTTAASMIMTASSTTASATPATTPPPPSPSPVDTPPPSDDFLVGIVVACIFLLVIVPSGYVGGRYYYVRHHGVIGTVPHVSDRPLPRWTRWRNRVRLGNNAAQFYDSVPSSADDLGEGSIPELHASVGGFMDAAAAARHRVN